VVGFVGVLVKVHVEPALPSFHLPWPAGPPPLAAPFAPPLVVPEEAPGPPPLLVLLLVLPLEEAPPPEGLEPSRPKNLAA
jgi:hypothetical protein